jgi:hypothetical protein
LHLRENNLHDFTGILLSEIVRENKTLLKLSLERNPITYKYTEDVEKSIN